MVSRIPHIMFVILIVFLSMGILIVQSVSSQQVFTLAEKFPSCYFMLDIPNGQLSYISVDENTAFVENFIGEDNINLYGFNGNDGRIQFKHHLGSANFCIDEERLYATEERGVFVARKLSGETVWSRELGENILHKPIIQDSKLYLVTVNSSLFVLNSD